MTDKVSLKPIQNLYIENILGATDVVGHQMVAELFQGTDTYLDAKGNLQVMVDKQTTTRTLEQEAAWVYNIKGADSNGDGFLDLKETRALIDATFSKEEAGKINEEQFLTGIEQTIQRRWARLALNMQKFEGDLNFKPTLDALDTYNDGIYIDEVRQAHSVFPLNGLGKTVGNIFTFPVYNTVFRATGNAQENWMLMDDVAEAGAFKDYYRRKQAMADLREVIQEGLFPKDLDEKGNPKKDEKGNFLHKAPEQWALDGKLSEALTKLKEKNPESYSILSTMIPAQTIHNILTIEDPKERANKLFEFAKGERPGFAGYFGGNATGSIAPWKDSEYKSWWKNYTGRHNNIYFARSVFAFLGNKSATGDVTFDENMKSSANLERKDMLGDGGSFANVSAGVLTNVVCGLGTWCETTPFRAWGDEARMDRVGRVIDIGIMAFTTYKGLQFWKEAWAFRRLKGLRGVGAVYAENASFKILPGMQRIPWLGPRFFAKGFKPIPVDAMRKAKEGAQTALAEAGAEAPKPTWFGRKMGVLKDKLFGNLPKLDEGNLKKALNAAQHGGGKFIAKLTDGVIIVGVTGYVDSKMEAYYNPFEARHELELDPYPDITKPDPLLTQPKK